MGSQSSQHLDDSGKFPYVRGSKQARDKSKRISRQLEKDFSLECQTVKLLLLGAGQSGKSTVVKQMKLIHPLMDREERGFTEEEKVEAQAAIYTNLADAMISLMVAVNYLNIEGLAKLKKQLDDKERFQKLRNIIHSYKEHLSEEYSIDGGFKTQIDSLVPTEEVTNALKELWISKTIQAAYERRNEFQLIDSTGYFMSALDRICKKDYEPSDQDILRVRVETRSVVKIEFDFQATKFEVIDVGGQRTERRKWIHFFDNVTSVLFVVSIAEYDQVLEEDSKTNRMVESMQLFDETANNTYFKEMPVIIFFNKYDLFLDKISKRGIKEIFPDYQGPDNCPNETLAFLTNKYITLSKTNRKKRPIYPHTTTATDTQLIDKVFRSVAEIILEDVLNKVGFA